MADGEKQKLAAERRKRKAAKISLKALANQ